MESEIERLRKKVENFPSASLYTRLAELQRQAGDLAGAEAVCRKCIKDFPRSGQAYVILAELQMHAGRRAEAKHLLEQAVEKEPRSYPAQRLLADLSDDKAEAISHLNIILSFKPGDAATIQRITELGGTVSPHGTRAFRSPSSRLQPVAGSSTASRPASTTSSPNIPAGPAPSPATGTALGGGTRSAATTSGDHIVPFPDLGSGGSGSGSRVATRSPLLPPSAASGTGGGSGLRRSRAASLDALCGEPGVQGAVLADAQGRVLASARLDAGKDELLAALALEVGRSAGLVQQAAGNPSPGSWVMQGSAGQVIAFTRDKDRGVTMLVVANPGIRPAMLELRARQVLVDLGGTL